jgi:hypothetical protein
MRKRFIAAGISLSVACGVVPVAVLSGPAAAYAAEEPPQVDATWARVEYLAQADPNPLIRAGAQRALATGDPALVARFLEVDYPYLVEEAALMAQLDREWCDLVLSSITPEDSPAVYAAAQAAISGSDADRAEFVRSGYAAAQQQDDAVRQEAEAAARALVERDRGYVRQLALTAPGEQVRAAASFATRPMATDRDLDEFFEHSWIFSADLDLEVFRRNNNENDTFQGRRVERRITAARDAEAAAQDPPAGLAEERRAAVERAWQDASAAANALRDAWLNAQHVAAIEAEHWATVVVDASGEGLTPAWATVAASAEATRAEWEAEQAGAAERAQYWESVARQAAAQGPVPSE